MPGRAEIYVEITVAGDTLPIIAMTLLFSFNDNIQAEDVLLECVQELPNNSLIDGSSLNALERWDPRCNETAIILPRCTTMHTLRLTKWCIRGRNAD